MKKPPRAHGLWIAYIAHRVSGLGLALFLPLHFYVLSLAMTDKQALDGFLTLTEMPLVKAAEWALVFCLALHLFGGLRLLALEWLPWSPHHKSYAAIAAAISFFTATLFLLQAI